MPEPLSLRSVYQTPLTSAASSQFVPAAPDGDKGTVCPPIRTVAFTENQGLTALLTPVVVTPARSRRLSVSRRLRCSG
jgi:hypothetical protein